MIKKISKNEMRKNRHIRIRETIFGTKDVPRLNVFKSSKHLSVQLIDDEKGITLASSSTTDKLLKIKNGGNVDSAKLIGEDIAKKAKALKIKKVVFDRGGYLYHGRVKAFADSARENGLDF